MRAVRRLARLVTTTSVAALSVVGLGGVALAFWTTGGSGTGAAGAGSFVPVVVTAGAAPAGQLWPGLTANGTTAGGDLVVQASNPNPFPVTVTVTQAGPATGCTTTGVTLAGSPTFTLPATSGTVTRTLTKVLSMSAASSNDCQGATITVPLSTSSVSG